MVERALTRMMETKSMNAPDSSVQHGSNNVFADLDLPDADSHLLKAELVSRVDGAARQCDMTQAEVARALGLSRPNVSRLLRGDFRECSMDRLFRFLMALGCDIEIVIGRSHAATAGTLRVAPSEVG